MRNLEKTRRPRRCGLSLKQKDKGTDVCDFGTVKKIQKEIPRKVGHPFAEPVSRGGRSLGMPRARRECTIRDE